MLSADFLSIFRGVVQLDFAAGALIGGIDDAGIERAGIDVQTNRSLIELARIENAVHRLERIHGTGLSWIHLYRVGRRKLAGALLQALRDDTIILNQQFSDGDRHPAVLVLMVVDLRRLSSIPAYGDEFK